MANEALEFTLEVKLEGVDTEEIDELTRQLLGELREQEVDSAELVTEGSTPPGTKAGEAITIGSIAVVVLPTIFPKLIEFLQAWTLRGQDRNLKFKGKIAGQDIEFEGKPEDFKTLLATLSSSGSTGSS